MSAYDLGATEGVRGYGIGHLEFGGSGYVSGEAYAASVLNARQVSVAPEVGACSLPGTFDDPKLADLQGLPPAEDNVTVIE